MIFNLKKLTVVTMSAFGTTLTPAYTVSDGKVSLSIPTQEFYTESPESRIEFEEMNGEEIFLEATYMGPTNNKALLASGVHKEQFGLKLRSVNSCNLVYVMRQLYPTSAVTIMYKLNVGMTTHAQCGDKGYVFVKSIPVPAIHPGDIVKLQARFTANILQVGLNGFQIWKGEIPFTEKGYAGFRSDNAKVKFKVGQ
jgi:hypothetical protein